MAVLFVTEYARIGRGSDGARSPIADEPPVANQTVSVTGASVQSNAFNSLTALLRLHADVTCSVAIGTNPTATTSSRRLAANATEYIAAAAGMKIAVISNT